MALMLCSLLGFSIYQLDADKKNNKTIKTTISANYDNVVNFHNDEDNKTFISDGSKYAFNYDENTKTLIVLKDSNTNVVFVDGIRQKGEKQ